MFIDVDFPASTAKDTFILKGKIKRFSWKLTTSPTFLILPLPIDNVDVEGFVALHVQLIDPKTDTVVGDYEKFSQKRESRSVYNQKALGIELAYAFQDVALQIKESIAADLQNGKLKSSSF